MNFNLPQAIYNQLVTDKAEAAFLAEAQDIRSITGVASAVRTSSSVSGYIIGIDITNIAFGTGIFQTLETLGVKEVDLGDGFIAVNSSNVGTFIDTLEALVGTTLTDEATKVLTLTYQAKIQQTGYAPFEANFTVNFNLPQVIYNQLVTDKAEAAFLASARLVEEISSGNTVVAENILTTISGNAYVISMDILNIAFGTGIFQTLETLGVKEVDLGDGFIAVNSSNVGTFIDRLELELINYDDSSNTNVIVITFDAKIDQLNQAPFESQFTITFDFNYDDLSLSLFNTLLTDARNN